MRKQEVGDGFAATCPSSLRSPEPLRVSAHSGDGQAQGRKRPNFDRGKVRRRLRERHGDKCYWCKRTMTFDWPPPGQPRPPNVATIEHIVPLSRGGLHDWSNLALACNSCNTSRLSRPKAL